jgi:hypothetical protein
MGSGTPNVLGTSTEKSRKYDSRRLTSSFTIIGTITGFLRSKSVVISGDVFTSFSFEVYTITVTPSWISLMR